MNVDRQRLVAPTDATSAVPVGSAEPGGEHDHPLSFHWRIQNPDIFDRLGLPAPRGARHARARVSILTEACLIGCAEPEKWISYSRRRDYYSSQQRYRGTPYTYDTVVPEIDLLTEFGLIENVIPEPGRRGSQSKFRATPDLINWAEQCLLTKQAEHDPHELIRLKDLNGRLKDYRDTDQTRRLRGQLNAFNEVISAANITLNAPGAVQDGNIIRCAQHALYLRQSAYYRVFNGSWQRGGRLYGPWWQSARSRDRTYIKINNELVVELDYPAHHLRMAYAIAHANPPLEPYKVSCWDRQMVKRAVLVMFNAKNYADTVGAVAHQIGGEQAWPRAKELIRAVKDLHAPVAHLFHSDLGVKLQRRDADMAADIMQRLLRAGIICLSVHDSFIVAAHFGGDLEEAMCAAWWKFLISTDQYLKAISYTESIPHTEVREPGLLPPSVDVEAPVVLSPSAVDVTAVPLGAHLVHCCSAPSPMRVGKDRGVAEFSPPLPGLLLPRLALVFPAPAQPDLFRRSCGFSIPLKELDGWSQGRAPPSIRGALNYEISRRGIRQVKLARRLGVSKQQLTNVLHGRSGASAALASGLSAFIREEAQFAQPSRQWR